MRDEKDLNRCPQCGIVYLMACRFTTDNKFCSPKCEQKWDEEEYWIERSLDDYASEVWEIEVEKRAKEQEQKEKEDEKKTNGIQ